MNNCTNYSFLFFLLLLFSNTLTSEDKKKKQGTFLESLVPKYSGQSIDIKPIKSNETVLDFIARTKYGLYSLDNTDHLYFFAENTPNEPQWFFQARKVGSNYKFYYSRYSEGYEVNKKALGDLTPKEIKAIQDVARKTDLTIYVVGSAARSSRRNIGSNFPIGKGERTQSDIDYALFNGDFDNRWKINLQELPNLDKKTGILNLYPEHFESEITIIFEPNKKPKLSVPKVFIGSFTKLQMKMLRSLR